VKLYLLEEHLQKIHGHSLVKFQYSK